MCTLRTGKNYESEVFARCEPSRSEAGEKRSRGLESESGVGGCCIITSRQLSLAPQTARYRTSKVQSLKATGPALYHTSLHCGSTDLCTGSAFTADPAPLKYSFHTCQMGLNADFNYSSGT